MLAAMDVSGSPNVGNYMFFALIVGTDQKLRSIIKYFEGRNIHMNQINDKKKKDHILNIINFGSDEILALCVKIDKDTIIKRIKNMREVKRQNIAIHKINCTFNQILMQKLRESINEFLQKHGYELSEIVFQCDGDCRYFAKDNNLKHTIEGLMIHVGRYYCMGKRQE